VQDEEETIMEKLKMCKNLQKNRQVRKTLEENNITVFRLVSTVYRIFTPQTEVFISEVWKGHCKALLSNGITSMAIQAKGRS
jgi:anion-transporting  ArsA/GET3 family ATPase